MKIIKAMARVIFATLCLPAFAQEAAPLPTYVVGDAWVYERVDRYNNTVVSHLSHEITSVVADVVKMRVKSTRGLDVESTYTQELNFVSNANGFSTSPPFKVFAFPLNAGSEWNSRFTRTQPNFSFSGSLKVKVVGFEKVTTPAGIFDTWVLEYHSHSDRGATAHERYWYAPAVKRVVQRDYEDKFANGQRNDYYREFLIGYRLAGQQVGLAETAGCNVDDHLCVATKARQ
jgi:hypothetical protein